MTSKLKKENMHQVYYGGILQLRMHPYLPSSKFLTLVFSLFASVGLVYAAQLVTRPHVTVVVSPQDAAAAAAHAGFGRGCGPGGLRSPLGSCHT